LSRAARAALAAGLVALAGARPGAAQDVEELRATLRAAQELAPEALRALLDRIARLGPRASTLSAELAALPPAVKLNAPEELARTLLRIAEDAVEPRRRAAADVAALLDFAPREATQRAIAEVLAEFGREASLAAVRVTEHVPAAALAVLAHRWPFEVWAERRAPSGAFRESALFAMQIAGIDPEVWARDAVAVMFDTDDRLARQAARVLAVAGRAPGLRERVETVVASARAADAAADVATRLATLRVLRTLGPVAGDAAAPLAQVIHDFETLHGDAELASLLLAFGEPGIEAFARLSLQRLLTPEAQEAALVSAVRAPNRRDRPTAGSIAMRLELRGPAVEALLRHHAHNLAGEQRAWALLALAGFEALSTETCSVLLSLVDRVTGRERDALRRCLLRCDDARARAALAASR